MATIELQIQPIVLPPISSPHQANVSAEAARLAFDFLAVFGNDRFGVTLAKSDDPLVDDARSVLQTYFRQQLVAQACTMFDCL